VFTTDLISGPLTLRLNSPFFLYIFFFSFKHAEILFLLFFVKICSVANDHVEEKEMKRNKK